MVHDDLAYFEISMCQIVKYTHHKASDVKANLRTAPGVRYHGFIIRCYGQAICIIRLDIASVYRYCFPIKFDIIQ
jgi:hypothetical protein